jgi:hypothetical protein
MIVEKLVIVIRVKYVYYLYMFPYLRMIIIIGVYFLMMFIADTFPTLTMDENCLHILHHNF